MIDETLEDLIAVTDKKISILESYLYSTILSYLVDNLLIDENKIKFNNQNISVVSSIDSVNDSVSQRLNKLGSYILNGIKKLIGITSKDMSQYDVRAISKSEEVEKSILRHAEKNININNNLEPVYAEIKQGIIAMMSTYEGASLSDIRAYLKERIKDKKIIDRYFNRWTNDIYSQYQRAAANEVRKKLGFKYAIYQGGLIETSRRFCIERNNKIFSEAEVNSWASLEFKGKPMAYNPIIDCGGYNCRHRLDWVSDEFAEAYKKLKK